MFILVSHVKSRSQNCIIRFCVFTRFPEGFSEEAKLSMEPLQEAMFKIGKRQSGPHPYRDIAILAVFSLPTSFTLITVFTLFKDCYKFGRLVKVYYPAQMGLCLFGLSR